MIIARPGAQGALVRTAVRLTLAVALTLGACLAVRAVLTRETGQQEAFAFIRAAARRLALVLRVVLTIGRPNPA